MAWRRQELQHPSSIIVIDHSKISPIYLMTTLTNLPCCHIFIFFFKVEIHKWHEKECKQCHKRVQHWKKKMKKETVREENNLIQTTEFPYSECQASGDINGYYADTLLHSILKVCNTRSGRTTQIILSTERSQQSWK